MQSAIETELPVYIGREAVGELVRYCAERNLERFLLVADQNTYPVLGQAVEHALAARGADVNPVVLTGPEVAADDHRIVEVLVRAGREERVYLAVGTGTLTDIARFCSHRSKATFISLPTAPSVDGFASGSASLAIGGLKQTVRAHPPVAIFADLPTLAAAPPPAMRASGFGDMLGKYTALADWQLGHLLWEEPYNAGIALRARDALQSCVDRVAQIGSGEETGIGALMQGLIESGQCMLQAGYSSPAAGAEHYMSHFWETKLVREHRPAILHGAQVAAACLLVAESYERIRRLSPGEVAARLAARSLPNRDREIAAIRQAYGPIADQIITQQSPFLNLTATAFEFVKQNILTHWADILDIAARVPPVQELSRLLTAAGGQTRPDALGLTGEDVAAAASASHYFRNRFTILKLDRFLSS